VLARRIAFAAWRFSLIRRRSMRAATGRSACWLTWTPPGLPGDVVCGEQDLAADLHSA
jgi:hypothetical protein